MNLQRQEKIGKRIKFERENLKLTQANLAEQLNLSADSTSLIRKWEKGKALPSVDIFFRMSQLFSCDIAYLLCEYDARTKEAADIWKSVGINEDAVAKLKQSNDIYKNRLMFNVLLSEIIVNLDLNAVQENVSFSLESFIGAGSNVESSIKRKTRVEADGTLNMPGLEAYLYFRERIVSQFAFATEKAFDKLQMNMIYEICNGMKSERPDQASNLLLYLKLILENQKVFNHGTSRTRRKRHN
ncbi:helix-turn-helix domain-containing protein [Candidatus Agathobaculum pullicola]|uniref:helix-turn-helix domain-containing protein n=1 Tax=Candidatus Agathobaculum pullicola TaxID=2838426 RepID=UPI003F91FBB8